MVKRTTFTTITPLPSTISRQVAIDFLHDHLEMIDLNPLIIERHSIPPPPHALSEEHRCTWYSLTDKISYLPGGVMSGQVSYTCAFHDLPEGLQTHCYAPMGLEIRDRWSVGGSLPGEPKEPVELGLGAPQSGLYLREDVDMRCNVLMAGFVKKTLKKSHGSLVDRLATKAHTMSVNNSKADNVGSTKSRVSLASTTASWTTPGVSSTRSDTSSTPPVGPLLPPPIGHQQSVPNPGLPHNQQYAGQTLGPYGEQSPPNSAGTLQGDIGPRASFGLQGVGSSDFLGQQQHPGLSAGSYADHAPQNTPTAQQNDPGLRPPLAPYTMNSQGSSNYSGNQSHTLSPYSDASGQASPGGQQHDGSLWPPPLNPQATNSQGGSLSYSGTIYKGNSKPQDYTEFSGLNPYEESKSPAPQEAPHKEKDGRQQGNQSDGLTRPVELA
ncbi:Fc.00g091460.m01.CDS01 [Cosmosporella sp. VM-42]